MYAKTEDSGVGTSYKQGIKGIEVYVCVGGGVSERGGANKGKGLMLLSLSPAHL